MTIKNFIRELQVYRDEEKKILDFVAHASGSRKNSADLILDVGCGFGRNLKLLKDAGFNVLGVEVNPVTVAANRAAGLPCCTPDELDRELQKRGQKVSGLLFSHVIEHFAPEPLLAFMNAYLEKLATGGWVVIATPLMSKTFFDDFDHVRPYPPESLELVFCGGDSKQMQYGSKHRLVLQDLWFRKVPWRWKFVASHYTKRGLRLAAWVNLLCVLIFRLSGSRLGRKDAWVGRYLT